MSEQNEQLPTRTPAPTELGEEGTGLEVLPTRARGEVTPDAGKVALNIDSETLERLKASMSALDEEPTPPAQ